MVEVVIEFMEKVLMSQFKVPMALVYNNGPTFTSNDMIKTARKYGILLLPSSSYYILREIVWQSL